MYSLEGTNGLINRVYQAKKADVQWVSTQPGHVKSCKVASCAHCLGYFKPSQLAAFQGIELELERTKRTPLSGHGKNYLPS
jgi:hypothetical protein